MTPSGVGKLARALVPAILCAQNFNQRGFIETDLRCIPKPRRMTAASRRRQPVSLRSVLQGAALAAIGRLLRRPLRHARRSGTHAHLDWQDRSLQRPALSLREFNATITKGKLTAEFGKQFIRWGKADILNPTDRFAPKDFLTVTDPDFLAVLAARVTYDTGTDSFDFVWQPRFTPSRTPLINERWTVLPQAVEGIALVDLGSEFPGRSAFGARWNHIGSGYEFSASFYDGFNSLPVFQGALERIGNRDRLCSHLSGAAIVWRRCGLAAALVHSQNRSSLLHVARSPARRVRDLRLQFERQIKELSIVAGYAGDAITARTPTLQFSPELGFARAILAHAQYTIDSNRSVPWMQRCARTGGEVGCAPNIPRPSDSIGAPRRATVGFAATTAISWASFIAIRSRCWRCDTASERSR